MNDDYRNDDEALQPEENIDLTELLRDDPELQALLGEHTDIPAEEEPTGPIPVVEEAAYGAPEEPVMEDIPSMEPEDEAEPQAPAPKRQRKRKLKKWKNKKGSGMLGIPHFLTTVILWTMLLAVGIFLGRVLWVCADDLLALTKPDKEISVTIDEDDTMADVAEKLRKAGLIRYEELFLAYADIANAEEKISPGTYTLNSMYDYHALVNGMRQYSSNRTTVTVVIPEGYNCRQIFEKLEENGVCTVEELEEISQTADFSDFWFLEDLEQDGKYCLEGYLFPDTYEFYTNDDPERVIRKFLKDFDKRFDENLRAGITQLNETLAEWYRANGYGEDYIEARKFTVREVVIVASMIEKETAGTDESATIASVIYNRLTDPANWPYLNIDATIQYILETPRTLTLEDLQIDDPYNTYKYQGLPPGPISNQGLYSLRAALMPEETNYYFYALDPDTSRHHFSKTSAEHEQFLASLQEDE